MIVIQNSATTYSEHIDGYTKQLVHQGIDFAVHAEDDARMACLDQQLVAKAVDALLYGAVTICCRALGLSVQDYLNRSLYL